MAEEQWTEFGWQGLRAEVPADWELVGIPKDPDPDQGYLRLDDRLYPRLELKWRAHPQRQFDVQKTLDNYLNGIKKTFRAEAGPLDIRRNQPFISNSGRHAAFHEHRNVTFFSWRGKLQAYGLIWRCNLCQRVLMAQAIGPPGEEGFRATAMRLFESLQDHPQGETNLWTAYGFKVETPRRYRLEKLQLLNGYILFAFGDGSGRIAVERYGLADQQMKGESLERWFRQTYAKTLKGTNFLIESVERLASPVQLGMDGRDARLLDSLDQWDTGAGRLWDKLFRRTRTVARLWHDAAANRIYVVRVSGKVNPEPLADRVVQTLPHPSLVAGNAR